jgi:hypothetical protein
MKKCRNLEAILFFQKCTVEEAHIRPSCIPVHHRRGVLVLYIIHILPGMSMADSIRILVANRKMEVRIYDEYVRVAMR